MIWCQKCGDGDCCERCNLPGCPVLCDECATDVENGPYVEVNLAEWGTF